MWEYGHRFTCILCSSNIKCQHLGGCVSGTRCHQIHIAKETAEISVRFVCQAVFIYLFHVKRRGSCSKHSHWKFIPAWERENVSFAFQGIASPYPSWSRRQLQHKETKPWCERQWCKKTLIHVILTELFCIYTSFTEMEAGLGSLHKLYILCLFLILFVTISHLLCWLFFICGMYSYSPSPSAKSILFKRRWHH